MWAYWLAVAAIYVVVRFPRLWAYLTSAPVLCPCYAQKQSWVENAHGLRLASAAFLQNPTEAHASVVFAAFGILAGQLYGYHAFRIPGDEDCIELLTARHRTTGCAQGLRPCPSAAPIRLAHYGAPVTQ